MNFYKYLIIITFSINFNVFAETKPVAVIKEINKEITKKSKDTTPTSIAIKKEDALLKKVISRYQTKNGVKANVEKIVDNKIMNKKTKFEGTMSWFSGKFKWDCTKPEKSLLLYDGKYIWSITEDEFFDPKIQVTRTSIQSEDKKILVNTFSEIMNRYAIKSNTTTGSKVQFELESKKSTNSLTKHITLVLEKEKNEIKEISYHDDLDNTTTIVFNTVSLNEKFKVKDFQYTPPKGVKVKDL